MLLQPPRHDQAPILRISGYTISQKAMDYFPDDLQEQMQDWYAINGASLSDKQLFVALEERFGNDIVQKVCVPHKLTQGGCLVAAVYLLRQNA